MIQPKVAFQSELLRHCASFAAGFNFIEAVPAETIITFSEDWMAEYQNRGLIMQDQVIHWGLGNIGTINWIELQKIDFGFSVDVISEARKFGFANGTVFSLILNGSKCVVGTIHEEERLSFDKVCAIHDLICSYEFARPKGQHVGQHDVHLAKLANTIEYLQLAASGLSDQQIAKETNLIVRSVYSRRNAALKAMKSSTVAEAVLKAHLKGYI